MILRHLWKRHVVGRPEQYQAYVAFPTAGNRQFVGDVHDRIEELEHVFEGRLDVYPRLRGVSVVTDRVAAEEFDVDAFETILDSVENVYAETHRLARLKKWRSIDGRVVASYVVVPVKPLFPHSAIDESKRIASQAD